MIKFADVIVDLQAGDTGKGKVAHSLCKSGEYTHVIRYNGGGNAGHTIYHEGKKIVTHFVPCGVLYGIKSIIGPGCVVNPIKLIEEIETLEKEGINVKDFLFVDKRVHVITSEHLREEEGESKIGTTKTGNGPAYRDKYWRRGVRFSDYMSANVIDIYEELHNGGECRILFEGAQGFELDIDWGDYPYVTSSHCTVGSAVLNGVPPQKIRKVYGVAKAYRTYVGAKSFEGDSDYFEMIRKEGDEYGSTTGRPRQINWLDINDLIKSININGVTNLIINKIDVLEKINIYNFIFDGKIINQTDSIQMQRSIEEHIFKHSELKNGVIFSKTPYDI